MNISFLTSSHLPYDDRIFYHMSKSLFNSGNRVEIVSSKCFLKETTDGIVINCFNGDDLSKRAKTLKFGKLLSEFDPEVIICSEPLTVIAAKKYSRKQSCKIRIIYDVTEWYPSKKNLASHKITARWLVFIKLILFNIWASINTDVFIFGEWYKSKPYRFLFPRKAYIFTTYYPNLEYINFRSPQLSLDRIRLSYSGRICLEKGFGNFMNVLNRLAEHRSDLQIDVSIIGWYENVRDEEVCKNLIRSIRSNILLKFIERQSFLGYLELVKDTDIFIDLRSDDYENQHCLPIRIFYYAAFGRPVVFSDLKAIRKEVDIDKFGYLVKPRDYEGVVNLLLKYTEDKELYQRHCHNARNLAENTYNWKAIEPQFLKFITAH